MHTLPAGLRGIIEVKADRRGRHAPAHEPRPSREVGKVEQGIGPLQADRLGKQTTDR
ncbi:MAG: hypothetical protein ACLPID_04095 [Beijerinckiaceae bacterium]